MSRVIVIGAGVIGLSCAVRLLERGHEVAVVARDLPLETTSAVAAALCYPHRIYPFERVTAWTATTYAELERLSSDDRTGVVMRQGTELLRSRAPRPWWAEAVPHLEEVAPGRPGYDAAWRLTTPVAEMPVYLTWLVSRVEALGGTVTRMALSGLPDQADVVVNAAGLGARLFAQDGAVVPVRGQVVLVEQVGVEEWLLDSSGLTFVVPRSRDVVVGGTVEEGVWDHTVDQAVAKDILARAIELVPELRRAKVLGHRVGLRPARPSVRLEATTGAEGGRVVHCYGHGGAGVTVSWGCADEVADLVDA
jgi:D-amino-acid oxidase